MLPPPRRVRWAPQAARLARFTKLTVVGGLTLSLGFAPGCNKPTPGGSATPTTLGTDGSRTKHREKAKAAMPEPLPLPDDPPAMVVLADPYAVQWAAAQVAPFPIDATASLHYELSRAVSEPWARQIADAVDLHRPWSAVELDASEAIAVLPITEAARPALRQALSEQPADGTFGAVSLPLHPVRVPVDGAAGPVPAPVLAWSPDGGQSLILARSPRGLITGPLLRARYGTTPIAAHVDIERLRLPIPGPIPFQRARVSGQLGDLRVQLGFDPDGPGGDPLAALELGPNTLAHLLGSTQFAGGVSAHWAKHKPAVNELIGQIQDQVDETPFLVKGWAGDLAAKFNSVARSWDGRFALALGNGHAHVAYGSSDPDRSGVALLRFAREAIDGLSIASTFVGSLPSVYLKKRIANVDGVDIHRLTVKNARSFVDRRLAPLLDDRGDLVVAMSFPAARGAGMIVVGPEPTPHLESWIRATSGSAAADVAGDGAMAGIHWALTGDQIRGLEQAASLTDILALRPNIVPAYEVDLRKTRPDEYTVFVHGPPPPPPPRTVVPG